MRATALRKFQQLEAPGSWRPHPGAKLREVVVSIGEATLILSDPKSEEPLAHWSLPAVVRLNPGEEPAIYAPAAPGGDETANETVEIDDRLMNDAIAKVHRAIDARRPHPGRLRHALTVAGILAMGGFALLWAPPALIRHAAAITPPAERAAIGDLVLAELARSTGQACGATDAGQSAQSVLDRLAVRLNGAAARLRVVPQGLTGAMRLPGSFTVVGRDLVDEQDTPDALAGHILAADLAARTEDPLLAALKFSGLRNVMRLLTTGRLPPDALSGYGEHLLKATGQRAPDDRIVAAFGKAGVSTRPYAMTVDPTGKSVVALIEADPFRTATAPTLMSDRDWVVAQQICED